MGSRRRSLRVEQFDRVNNLALDIGVVGVDQCLEKYELVHSLALGRSLLLYANGNGLAAVITCTE